MIVEIFSKHNFYATQDDPRIVKIKFFLFRKL